MTLWKWSKTPASNASADSTINWAEGQSPGSVNDSARAMMAATAKFRDDIAGGILTVGTSTAFAITSNQSFSSLAAMSGHTLAFTAHATSGASPTLNVDGLGAKPIQTASGAAIAAGALLANAVYRVTYDNSIPAFLLNGYFANITPGAATVDTAQLVNNAVTYGKMQDVSATARILARKTAGAGDPEECTLSDILDFISSAAQGDILYRGASTWARLGAGTAGQVLYTNGVGANPSWGAGPVFTKLFTSAQQTIAVGTTLPAIAHGLGAAPAGVQCIIHCISADAGYAVGDELLVSCALQGVDFVNTASRGLTISFDVTNLNVKYVSNSGTVFSVAGSNLTDSKWKLIIKAWV